MNLDSATCSHEELARAAQLDQGVWLDELYRRFEERIFGCVHQVVARRRRGCGSGDRPESPPKAVWFRGGSSITTWMDAVARHTCLDVRKR